MNLFQWVAAPLATLLALRSLAYWLRGGTSRRGHALGIAVWLLALLTILRPDLTTDLANRIGIGRGADLVLYAVALGFAASTFYFYQKYRQLSSEITTLTRHLALRDAQTPEDQSNPAGRTGAL